MSAKKSPINPKISVIIPLYNKEAEIERTLRSVLAQTIEPHEVIVVDDGSTDGSAMVVEMIMAEFGEGVKGLSEQSVGAKIRLVRQKNAGVSAARNRGMEEATGDFFALLDADDEWKSDFLKEIAGLVSEFPDCGLYSTGFEIVDEDGIFSAKTLSQRGVVDNFFRTSMSAYVSIPSTSVIPRWIVKRVGGFPEGMNLGEDQYMWIKIAREFSVCFSPEKLVRYYKAASNRSAAIFRPEKTIFSFADFLDNNDFWLREFVARAALGKALIISAKKLTYKTDNGAGNAYVNDDRNRYAVRSRTGVAFAHAYNNINAYVNDDVNRYAFTYAEHSRPSDAFTYTGKDVEREFAYNRHSRRLWWRLWVMNRLPASWRPVVHRIYSALAWKIAKKGL